MSQSMNNIQGTTNQNYSNNLPHIGTLFYQNFDAETSVDCPQGFDPQECDNYVRNDNHPINNSNVMHSSTNNVSNSSEYPASTNQDQNSIENLNLSHERDTTGSKQIRIKSQPRASYHPRTEKENEKVAHYIRCEEGDASEYPSIFLYPAWASESNGNYIEVALVDIKNKPHPYMIENKQQHPNEGEMLPYRPFKDVKNILNFPLTDQDFEGEGKEFKIELIKPRQDAIITKDIIRTGELHKSKLRFTRIFRGTDGSFYPDTDSTVYSNVMTESYGDIRIKHITPEYGPISGDHLLDISFINLKSSDKKKLSLEISEQTINWTHKIEKFDSTGNTIHVSMPRFPRPEIKTALATVIVYYEEQKIYESPHLYSAALDDEIRHFNLNKPIEANANPTTSNNSDKFDQDLTDDIRSSSIIPKKQPKKKFKKAST